VQCLVMHMLDVIKQLINKIIVGGLSVCAGTFSNPLCKILHKAQVVSDDGIKCWVLNFN